MQAAVENFAQFFKTRKNVFSQVVPVGIDAEKLFRVANAAYSRTPGLWECTMDSVYLGMQQAASLGLEILSPLGHAYLVPRKNKNTGKKEALLVIGYKGLQEIARRSGDIDAIDAIPVYANDVFEYEETEIGPKVRHRPTMSNPGELIAAYSRVRMKTGTTSINVMRKADIDRRMKKGSPDSEMWSQWPEEGARKTVFRNHFKWLPVRADDLERLGKVEGDDDVPVDWSAAAATEESQPEPERTQPALPEAGTGAPSRATDAAKEAMRNRA